jgi:hypothetical protein
MIPYVVLLKTHPESDFQAEAVVVNDVAVYFCVDDDPAPPYPAEEVAKDLARALSVGLETVIAPPEVSDEPEGDEPIPFTELPFVLWDKDRRCRRLLQGDPG